MGNKVQRLKKEDTVLVAIDFQEKLMPAMKNKEGVEAAAAKLIKGCRILGVPVIITQQYTKGLGPTVADILAALNEPLEETAESEAFQIIEKTSFSSMAEPEFVQALKKLGRKTVIIAGVEAHVCVQQTVIDLLDNGYTVFVANDCISSRNNEDKKYSQRRMGDAGAVGTTFESILFELLIGSKESGFKQISALVK
ncbi:MAG: hydrolase [Eubacteriales bacterium]|nr:hydrolase [Eubacteriales bacterium]MDD3199169.1 hydrolase [Eubacteriales bacterium]MDD4121882.1 hydrolase [Eubacteriales bacterium]MDD4629176.1 hydrolase [Eubacteriales bacterium]